MTAITIMQVSKEELQHMMLNVATEAVAQYIGKSSETWDTGKVAQYLGVSTRTIANWEKDGKLPPRIGRNWEAADIIRWHKERQQGA